ncbi:TetM/TetW/TetO/TetS family tetracycline resistance ribosomal protection protein [Paenibacillus sp. 19GGS1-52]|uniref:GTP-binding protein n=1 Tax=Paenibacillus sp. 19GGS1-52 TaxID=2758563 RepID=UPI001EFA6F66|nr:TetM/TetW/TetO/TetS family tetracycline resistance ribosomal protection protein [Paenibacillus sp. 19GGS1-52]
MSQQQETERINVGIFAHVDAGKTTTTEHILYESGRIRALGSVDSGTALTDSMDIERQRGISVRAALASFAWKGVQINLVDTPGHVDFLSEVERSLRVMDCAVLILSAVEGVQAQTEMIWNALRKLEIPTLILMNKMDRVGADPDAVLAQARNYLSTDIIPVQCPMGEEHNYRGAADLWETGAETAAQTELLEALAERDEKWLETYMSGRTVNLVAWKNHMSAETATGRIFPLVYGVAAKGLGITALLDAMIDYFPRAGGNAEAPVSGIVYNIQRDKNMGRMAFVRLYEGTIRNRDTLLNYSQDIQGKVTQIRKVEGGRVDDVGALEAGDIAVVYGLSGVRVGDVLGHPEAIPQEAKLAVPLLTVRVHWAVDTDDHKVIVALQELADEDPLLDTQWLQDERELHIKVMGPIQLEILDSVMVERYGLKVTFGQPSVIYKETPSRIGEGFIAYLMPKPCWAILRFHIEPGPPGSGLVYDSVVRSSDLLPQYQNETARRVPEALQQGLYGWEVTDLKITLVEGQHHV